MSESSGKARSAALRAELEETLDAIEDKFNVPKQVGLLSTKARTSWNENPLPWVIGATGAVIVVAGLVAWALSNDD